MDQEVTLYSAMTRASAQIPSTSATANSSDPAMPKSKQELIQDLTAAIWDLCEGASGGLGMDADDIWEQVMLGPTLGPNRKKSYYNKFLQEARLIRERNAAEKEGLGSSAVGGSDGAGGSGAGGTGEDERDISPSGGSMRLEEKAVAADRKRWQEMKAAGTLEQWCREYDLRHAEVEKELVKRKTALQEGKAVINMGLKLKNAMHELSLYDVESAFILVPNYNNKYKKWSGQYLSSSKCMDQAIRRKVPLCTNPKDPGEVATAYKRGYDEAYENLAKAAISKKRKRKGGKYMEEYKNCAYDVSSELCKVLQNRTVEQSVPWSDLWSICYHEQLGYDGVDIDFLWKPFADRAEIAYTPAARASVTGPGFRFYKLDIANEELVQTLKHLQACADAYKEIFRGAQSRAEGTRTKWDNWKVLKETKRGVLNALSTEDYLKTL